MVVLRNGRSNLHPDMVAVSLLADDCPYRSH